MSVCLLVCLPACLSVLYQVAWLYEQIHRRQVEAMMEVVPMEYATAYPNSVLRDSLGLLTKVTPLQVLKSRYKIQFVATRSHTRVSSVAGELQEKWLQALFSEFSNPDFGVLTAADDGSLDLAPTGRSAGEAEEEKVNGISKAQRTKEALGFFTAMGRAMAMAIVSRTFVDLNLSPALCKLILGRPVHFMDLLNTNHELFRDLLKLTMMPADAARKLKVKMPETTMGTHGGPDTPMEAWPGRDARAGDRVTVHNRLEFVYRKMEGDLFTRIGPQFAALRKGLFDVIPQELFSIFDDREFLMLINGHHTADNKGTGATVWL